MFEQLIWYLKGYVRIRITGYSPERFLNACRYKNIYIWDLKRVCGSYEMNLTIDGFRRLKEIVRKTGTKVCIIRRSGLPFLLHRYRKRHILLSGFLICAGLILLAEHIAGDDTVHFGTLPVTVKRNAYGRQLGSFHYAEGEFVGIGTFPMEFIRAPYVESVSDGVEVLAEVDGRIVGVRYGKQLAVAFHPELGGDHRIHQWFLEEFIKQ